MLSIERERERAAMSAAVERERRKVDTIIAGDRITDEQYGLLPNDEDIIRCHRLAGAVPSSSPPNDWSAIATMKGLRLKFKPGRTNHCTTSAFSLMHAARIRFQSIS